VMTDLSFCSEVTLLMAFTSSCSVSSIMVANRSYATQIEAVQCQPRLYRPRSHHHVLNVLDRQCHSWFEESQHAVSASSSVRNADIAWVIRPSMFCKFIARRACTFLWYSSKHLEVRASMLSNRQVWRFDPFDIVFLLFNSVFVPLASFRLAFSNSNFIVPK
jgi:hypothetical protein